MFQTRWTYSKHKCIQDMSNKYGSSPMFWFRHVKAFPSISDHIPTYFHILGPQTPYGRPGGRAMTLMGPLVPYGVLWAHICHIGHALTETAWIFSWALIKSLHSQSNPVRRYEQFYVLFVMSVMKLYMLQHVGHGIEYFPGFMSMIFLYFLDELRRS